MPTPAAILWFRNDLRLADNRALAATLATGAPVVPVYILDDEAPGQWRMGRASRWWLAGSLAALGRDLEARGARLVLRKGRTEEILAQIAEETGAKVVHASRAYEPWAAALERRLKAGLSEKGIDVKRYAGTLLAEPESLRTQAGEPFKVYTPFWRALSERTTVAKPLAAPDKIPGLKVTLISDRLDDWALRPTRPDWAGGMRDVWRPGEAGAQERLARFASDRLSDYDEARDVPSEDGTSRLSPHLHFGELSPAQCWHAALAADGAGRKPSQGLDRFLKELVWREFSYHLLAHWPDLPEAPFRPAFAAYPWQTSKAALRAWQRGETGYPLVDAGMRQLWGIGWMHNRVRMVVASFLIKHLLTPWQNGEAWFWDTLVDADLASNAASWQWVAGSGADAAPYFRIFNPVAQGEKFDPAGDYVRAWVPELARLPAPYIHAPWLAPKTVLAIAGVELGRTYPLPIVDHATQRALALAGYEQVKAAAT